MIDKTKLRNAQQWIEKLANGINPLTSKPVKNDDVVNNVHISRCLYYVHELLSQIESLETVQNRQRTFRMSSKEAEQIVISSPNGIGQFTKIINDYIPVDMKPLTVVKILKWLRNEGYMYEEKIDENHNTNLPTEKGKKIGITVSVQKNSEGKEYRRVIYEVSAQRFILENIESIVFAK